MTDAAGSKRRRSRRSRCPLCGKAPTLEGYDACLGELPGVANACCGHGEHPGYIQFANGLTIRGFFEHTAPMGNPAMKEMMPDQFQVACVLAASIQAGYDCPCSPFPPFAESPAKSARRPRKRKDEPL